MDILDRIAQPLGVIAAFAMMALIVHRVGQCIRAFVQGINEADDPRYARPPSTDAGVHPMRKRRSVDRRSLKTTLKWVIAYFASVPIMFVCLTTGGWMRLDYTPELFVSLIVPLLVLRLLASILRLG